MDSTKSLIQPKKMPASSPVGLEMDNIMAKLKMHKAHKGVKDSIGNMQSSLGMIKKAYLDGVKYAEEEIESDSDNGETSTNNQDESSKIISILRRGWPDVKSGNSSHGETDKYRNIGDGSDPYFSRHESKQKTQLTKYSPETTI